MVDRTHPWIMMVAYDGGPIERYTDYAQWADRALAQRRANEMSQLFGGNLYWIANWFTGER